MFTGSVVAVQGDSTIKCTELAVVYEAQRTPGKPAASAASSPGDGAIRRIDCKGPVTIVSKTQTATGDNAVFDRAANRIELTGNATISDGQNVTTGQRIVYDLHTGVANVIERPGGRVRALIVPGSGSTAGQGGGGTPAPQPQPAARRAPPTN